jgi:hypothetical protein
VAERGRKIVAAAERPARVGVVAAVTDEDLDWLRQYSCELEVVRVVNVEPDSGLAQQVPQ